MVHYLRVVGLIGGLTLSAIPAKASSSLDILAEIEPWPVVSRLIGYGDRLWFANSVKGRNHNSADLYSFDLKTGDVRYERHLFSQDAGRPVIFDGRLHWPFEDARFSLGYGHIMSTDGRRWTEKIITSGRIFHTHALTATDHLIAATSAWRAHIDLSFDGGATWRQVYDHPTPDRRVSRIVDLVTLGERVFGSLTSRDERGLLDLSGPSVKPVPAWPINQTIKALTVYRGRVYGLLQMQDRMAIWRTDGDHSEHVVDLDRIGTDRPGSTARDLIADEQGLWLLMSGEGGGQVWQGRDGEGWIKRHEFSGGTAFELASYQGQLFVGGTDQQREKGLLWGSFGDRREDPVDEPLESWTELRAGATNDTDVDWTAAGAELDRLLTEPAAYQNRARTLRDMILDLSSKSPPPGFFTSRLAAVMPKDPMSLIGGAVRISSAMMGRALLLFGAVRQGEDALSATAQIPLELLQAPWNREANQAEKYFDTLPFALWAIGGAQQNDRATIDALIDRLAEEGDPLWLTGDVVGVLTATTDQRFAYDLDAWRAWWAKARASWKPH